MCRVVKGTSSNKAVRSTLGAVKLSTTEGADFDSLRGVLVVESLVCDEKGSGRSSLGDSGENEGNEVKDLSEIEDAELDIYEVYFLDLTLTVCDRELFAEALEWWELDLWSEGDPTSSSIARKHVSVVSQ